MGAERVDYYSDEEYQSALQDEAEQERQWRDKMEMDKMNHPDILLERIEQLQKKVKEYEKVLRLVNENCSEYCTQCIGHKNVTKLALDKFKGDK